MTALHAHLAANVAPVLQPEEFLRAEWVARLSALDLYVHELVAQNMVAVFEGTRPPSPGYLRFHVSTETLTRIHTAPTQLDAVAAFDLEVRDQLSYSTFQDAEKIAEAIRLYSSVELWNEVALHLGATQATKSAEAKSLKKSLSLVVRRRNRIAHEGDLQPSPPRAPVPISSMDLRYVEDLIERIVRAIDVVAA